jgi:SPOR domain
VSKIFDALKQAELANRSRQQLAATPEKPAPAIFVVHATDSVHPPESPARADQRLGRHGISRHLIWFFLGVLLISAAVIFLRHHARGVADRRSAPEIKSEASAPGILSVSSTVEPSTPAPPATLPSDVPGFVLQVAAMKHEDNAEALERTLHQKNFPAFVFKRGAGTLYQVAIGVYGDSVSAVRVKDELEKQGFEAVLKRWLPD